MQEKLENRTTFEVEKPPCLSQNVLISPAAPKSSRDLTQPFLHRSFLCPQTHWLLGHPFIPASDLPAPSQLLSLASQNPHINFKTPN